MAYWLHGPEPLNCLDPVLWNKAAKRSGTAIRIQIQIKACGQSY
jgi:hypothetical protein